MALVLKGRTQVADLPNFVVGDTGAKILDIIEIGNSKEVQSTEALNSILASIEQEKGVGKGSKLPIEHFNIYFQEGGIETASAEMKKYIEEFTVKHSMGYNVMGFDYSLEDEVQADNNGINLNAEAQDKVAKITRAYTANYLPYARLCALLTGTNLTAKCPTKSTGTDRGYADAFGFLRGEDVSDWLLPTAKDKKRNHYRTIKGETISESDIYDVVRMLTSYRTYSKRGIIVLGSPSNIQKLLGNTYTAPTNIDEVVINGYVPPKPFGCEWIGVPELEGHDFFIFLDKGRYDILFRRVEPSEKYRGLGILTKDSTATFKTVTDIQGAKLRIFPEEWYLIGREAGAILDIDPTRSHSSGEMQDGGSKSIKALEGLAELCLSAYDLEHQMKLGA